MNDAHLEQICDKALTNKERLELLYRKVAKEKRDITGRVGSEMPLLATVRGIIGLFCYKL